MSRAEGVWGEAQIANYLRRRRYELLAHSYHCRFGEIDLIARKGGVLYRLRIWFWMREPTVSANWSRERMRAKFRP